MFCLRSLLIVVLFGWLCANGSAQESWWAGFGKAEITPRTSAIEWLLESRQATYSSSGSSLRQSHGADHGYGRYQTNSTPSKRAKHTVSARVH